MPHKCMSPGTCYAPIYHLCSLPQFMIQYETQKMHRALVLTRAYCRLLNAQQIRQNTCVKHAENAHVLNAHVLLEKKRAGCQPLYNRISRHTLLYPSIHAIGPLQVRRTQSVGYWYQVWEETRRTDCHPDGAPSFGTESCRASVFPPNCSVLCRPISCLAS